MAVNVRKEIIFDALALGWLLFVLTNANTNLGNAYLWFIGVAVIFLLINMAGIFDRGVRVTYEKNKHGFMEALFAAIIGWVIILAISFFALKFADPTKANFASIVASFGAANPVFSTSKIVNFLTISFAVGYAETMLWARGAELIADIFHIPINRANKFKISFVVMAIILAVLFMIFHLTSKGVSAVSSLVVVFIMMLVSLFLIAYFNGEAKSAVLLHIISNGVAGALLLAGGGLLA